MIIKYAFILEQIHDEDDPVAVAEVKGDMREAAEKYGVYNAQQVCKLVMWYVARMLTRIPAPH